MALVALLIAAWLGIIAQRRRVRLEPHWRLVAGFAAGGALLALVLLLVDLESQKLALRLLTPLGLAWTVLLGLALHLLLAGRRREGWTALGCWLALGIGGNAWIGSWLLGTLERSLPAASGQPWDAVAVLGGGTALDHEGGVQLGASGDRLRVAAAQHRGGTTPLLVTLGSGILGSERGRDLAAETAAVWSAWGVPEQAVLRLPGPVNTSQEVARLAAEARARGWRRIGLVSSAWHLPRALALARRHGLAADPVPADWRGRPPPLTPVHLVPSGQGLHETQLWLNEILGRLAGR